MAISTGAAIIGSAVVGGLLSNRAAGKAADAQVQAAGMSSEAQLQATREGIAAQERALAQARADQAPWREAGGRALATLEQTLPGLTRSFGLADYAADPGYQFRRDEGLRGIEHSAAARGGLMSGNTLKALARFNSGLAAQEYGGAYDRFNANQANQFNRLASLAGLGQTAANQTGAASMSAGANTAGLLSSYGTALGNNLMQAGNARASGYVGGANAISNGISQGLGAWQNYQLMQRLPPINPGTWSGYGTPGYANNPNFAIDP